MLARLLRFWIFVVLVLSAGLGWLCGLRSPIALGLVALCGPVAVVVFTVVFSFLRAHAWSTSTVAAESLAALRLMLFTMPFAPGPYRQGDPQGAPVLLVHGFFSNRGAMRPVAERLAAEGFRVESIDLEPVYAGIEDYIPALADKIGEMRARAAGKRVAVVCHSMGGLAMRAYVARHGESQIGPLVTLGTPHKGTVLARRGAGKNVRQMVPDSPWLRALESAEAGNAPRVTAVWSTNDNIVAPQESAAWPGPESHRFARLGHLQLLFDAGVHAQVVRSLRAPGAL